MDHSINRELVVPADRDHIECMRGKFREVDELEARITGSGTAYRAAVDAFYMSRNAWVGLLWGEPILMFGHSRDNIATSTSTPWFLATDNIEGAGLSILRQSKKYVNIMREESILLETKVHKDNKVSLRWLKWCGFHIGELVPYGDNRDLCYRVWL